MKGKLVAIDFNNGEITSRIHQFECHRYVALDDLIILGYSDAKNALTDLESLICSFGQLSNDAEMRMFKRIKRLLEGGEYFENKVEKTN